MSQTRSFIFDAGSNYLRMVATILGTVFLTRAMALRWGVDDFGRWSLITTVMSLTLLLDLGLSNVVLKVAGTEVSDLANEVLSSVFVALFVLSVLASFLLTFAMHALLPGMGNALTLTVVLLSVRATVASLPWTVCRSALYARGKMTATNLMQSIGILAYSAVASVMLFRGATLVTMAAVLLVFTAVDSLLLLLLLKHYIPGIKLRLRFHYGTLRPLLAFGGASLLVNVAGFILLKTDPIIVKTFLPFAQVAMYAVALRIAENIFLLCKQLVNALTPHAIRAGAAGSPLHRGVLFERVSRYVMALGAPIYVSVLLLGKVGIRLWLSREYEPSAVILNVLLLAMILSIPQLVGSNLLTFSGQHKRTATFITVGAFINVASSVIFVHMTGATGVAYGTLLTTLIIDVAIVVPFACRQFELRMTTFAFSLVKSILLPCVLQAVALVGLSRLLIASTIITVAADTLVGLAVFFVAFAIFGTNRAERQTLIQAISPRLHSLAQLAEAR